ncbi:hypothetical protein [Anaeromyxobacter sp. Fw109-5]|uniref:hypothetical protein n=1 Tax=Anaeromyxobacter sp. (strain Fw109-5) TaxID=404589 RepID=UPI000158A4C5|nr:hypothetical protein [Anaeromyxobacter sp. Fw109-5]ABS27275.1 conserved hypothetical protein [Anaeromyxobacter sp. Fw109-5]
MPRSSVLLAALAAACAPAAGRATIPLGAHPAAVRLGYERLHMPGGERPLALAEVAWLAELPAGLYAGPALLGAVGGERGGFFVAGVEAGLRLGIAAGVGLDAGLLAGGGGGGSAPVGGGLMLRPRLALTWSGRRDRLSVGIAHAVFPTGDLRSTQPFLAWERRFEAAYARAPLDPWTSQEAGPLRFSRTSLELRLARYGHPAALGRLAGARTLPELDLVGAAAGFDVAGPLSLRVESTAAYGGGSGGYMEVLAGPALRLGLGSAGAAVLAFTAGSGGGGGVPTGDGLLVKGAAGFEVRPAASLRAGIEAGAVAAPSTSFRAVTLAVKVGWELELAGPPADVGGDGAALGRGEAIAVSWRLRPSVQRYATSQRRSDAERAPPVDQLAFKADLLLSRTIYLTAQSGWAFAGGAGAWATGLLGAGIESPSWRRQRLGIELLAGAGGGGGISTEGGALLHASVSWLLELTPRLGIQLAAGRARAVGGRFDSLVLDGGVVFRGASLARAAGRS